MGHSSKYKVDKPYPTVKIECPNHYCASLLLDDYASRDSEYTAISQYVFGHILAGDPEIADTFLGIVKYGIAISFHMEFQHETDLNLQLKLNMEL